MVYLAMLFIIRKNPDRNAGRPDAFDSLVNIEYPPLRGMETSIVSKQMSSR